MQTIESILNLATENTEKQNSYNLHNLVTLKSYTLKILFNNFL